MATTYLPPSISRTSRSFTVRPLPCAKPSAARVGVPSALKARLAGGPLTTVVRSFCFSARSSTIATSRRGVPWMVILPCARRNSSSNAGTRSFNWLSAVSRSAAGSSSLPISSRKGAGLVGSPVFETVLTAAVVGCFSFSRQGKPSASRWATYSSALRCARSRIRPNSTCRSVTPTAPRVSRMLKICEHFRT